MYYLTINRKIILIILYKSLNVYLQLFIYRKTQKFDIFEKDVLSLLEKYTGAEIENLS